MRGSLILFFMILMSGAMAQELIIVGKKNDRKKVKEIQGRIVDDATEEGLIGVNIYIPELKSGATTDVDGNFALGLERGTYIAQITSIGYASKEVDLMVQGSGTVTIRLKEDLQQLSEVVVTSTRADANVKSTDLGKEVLSLDAIESLPAFVGEVDVLKSLTLLPGISTVGEASSGFNVRGGGSDQNLILLGDGALYNSSHLFGFFSSFNSDLVRDVTVYKGGIPANYGGRASSIVDIQYKDGDTQNWNGQATIGMISTKVTADGPIIKDKLSVVLGGRVSYVNWLLRRSKNATVSNADTQFYDGNAIVNFFPSDNHKITYSYYNSFDRFSFTADTTISWRNQIHSLIYRGQLSDRFFTKVSVVRSQYDYSISNEFKFNGFDLESKIIDNGFNAGLEFKVAEENTMQAGFQAKYITITPSVLTPTKQSSLDGFDSGTEQGIETGIYFQHDLDITKWFRLSYGLRYARFNYLGANEVYGYEENLPRRVENITDTTFFDNNESVTTFDGWEPRVSLRFAFNESTSIKFGYNRIYQFIHLITNTTTIAPTDTWKLSDPYLSPAVTQQFSAGFFKNFFDNAIETSIEGYLKEQDGIIEYKDGAQLLLNNHLETELINGTGRAYGVELYLKKNKGRSRGWVSYTFSRSLRQVIGNYAEETINGGEWYASNFDKPHDFTAVYELRINPYIDFSSVFTYSTGRPATYPVAKFDYVDQSVAYFQDRNRERAPDYHRLDVSLDFRFNTIRKWLQGDWKLSIYNVYGADNAFSVFFDDVVGAPPQAYQLSILTDPFFSVSYTIKL